MKSANVHLERISDGFTALKGMITPQQESADIEIIIIKLIRSLHHCLFSYFPISPIQDSFQKVKPFNENTTKFISNCVNNQSLSRWIKQASNNENLNGEQNSYIFRSIATEYIPFLTQYEPLLPVEKLYKRINLLLNEIRKLPKEESYPETFTKLLPEGTKNVIALKEKMSSQSKSASSSSVQNDKQTEISEQILTEFQKELNLVLPPLPVTNEQGTNTSLIFNDFFLVQEDLKSLSGDLFIFQVGGAHTFVFENKKPPHS